MISILGAGCSTAAGAGVPALMRGLQAGTNFLSVDAFRWPDHSGSVRTLLSKHLGLALREAWVPLTGSYGVILASTKGFTEDFVWQTPGEIDPLTPVLDDVIAEFKLKPARKICVSNACASSLAALSLAQLWLEDLDHVIVLAADAVDSFVLKGFASLRVLTNELVRPFDAARSGFYLGDAAACVILSKQDADVALVDAHFDSEGYAVTRPSLSGDSLLRACLKLGKRVHKTDLVIAHGTATRANDETEDRVFGELFTEHAPLITGTKWMIGHTLGASGLIDTIAAREAIRSQQAPALMNTSQIDPSFSSRYLTGEARSMALRNVLVTSLGFGGVHAAALVAAT